MNCIHTLTHNTLRLKNQGDTSFKDLFFTNFFLLRCPRRDLSRLSTTQQLYTLQQRRRRRLLAILIFGADFFRCVLCVSSWQHSRPGARVCVRVFHCCCQRIKDFPREIPMHSKNHTSLQSPPLIQRFHRSKSPPTGRTILP